MATPSAAGNSDDYSSILQSFQDTTPVWVYYDRYLLTTKDFAHLVEKEFHDLIGEDPPDPRFLVTGEEPLDVLEDLYYGNSFFAFFDQLQLGKETETNAEGKAILKQVVKSLGGTASDFALGYVSPQDPFFGMFTDPKSSLDAVGVAYSSPGSSCFIVSESPTAQKKWGYRFSRAYFLERGDRKSYRVFVSSEEDTLDAEPSEEFIPTKTREFMQEIQAYFLTLRESLASVDASLRLMYEARGHTNGSQTTILHLTYLGNSERSMDIAMSQVREKIMDAAEYIATAFEKHFPKMSDKGI